MKYKHDDILEALCAPYVAHPLFRWVKVMASNFVYDVSFLLSDADELIFQRQPEASVPMLTSMLERCKDMACYDDFSSYLRSCAAGKKQKSWLNYSKVINYYNRLKDLHHFLHGAWEQIDSRVFTGEGYFNKRGQHIRATFQVPVRSRKAFVELTHQLTQAHLQEVITQLAKAPYITSWLSYDRSLELTRVMEPYQEGEHAPLLLPMITRMSIEMDAALKAADRLFGYLRTPESHVFMIRLLDLTQCVAHEAFDSEFQKLCEANSKTVNGKTAIALKQHVQWLRLVGFFQHPRNVLEPVPVEYRKEFSKTVSGLLRLHIESMRERLEESKELSIQRTKEGIAMRYRALPDTHKHKEKLKQAYDELLSAQASGKYVCKKPADGNIRFSSSLFTPVTPLKDAVPADESTPYKRARHI